MGNTICNPHTLNVNDITIEQNDYKYIGNHYPLGDDEIKYMYEIYQSMLLFNHNNNKQTSSITRSSLQSSYLYCISKHCFLISYDTYQKQQQSQQQQQQQQQQSKSKSKSSTSRKQPPQQQNDHKWANQEEVDIAYKEKERRILFSYLDLIDIIENKILPFHFFDHLYEILFLPPEHHKKKSTTTTTTTTNDNYPIPESMNDNNNNNNTVNNAYYDSTTSAHTEREYDNDYESSITNMLIMDEYTRKTYLDSFFRGITMTTRRGSRAAIEAMFLSCPDISLSSSSSSSSSKECNNESTNEPNDKTPPPITNNKNRKVRAKNLIDIGYRLALATAFLNHNHHEQQDNNDDHNNDKEEVTKNDETNQIKQVVEEEQEGSGRTKEHSMNSIGTTLTTSTMSSSTSLFNVSGRERYLPPTSIDNDTLHPILDALSHSLIECAKSRYQRSYGNSGGGNHLMSDTNTTTNNSNTTIVDIETYGLVELDDVYDWLENIVPLFGSIISSFIDTIFSPKKYIIEVMNHHNQQNTSGTNDTTSDITNLASSSDNNNTTNNGNNNVRTNYTLPSVPEGSSNFFTCYNSPLLFTFGCLSPSLAPSDGTSYHRLYSSTNDGLSFNRLLNSLLGYSGPTLFIIRSIPTKTSSSSTNNNKPSIFGAYTSTAWKESKDFYGNTDCFLYQLSPCTAVYRPKGSEKNYMYCNSAARSRGYDQQPHGIGFGGTINQPRLFLDETFDNNIASFRDLTFDNGHILPSPEINKNDTNESLFLSSSYNNNSNYNFDIDCIEVWGVGTIDVITSGLQNRVKQRDMTNNAIQRARKVDKAQFLDDLRSGVIDSKAFKHRTDLDGGRIDIENDFKKIK